MRSFFRKVPWWAVALSAAVLLAGAFHVDPVRDAVTLQSIEEVSLALSPAYLAIAPASDVLDTLTLLTVAQHIAVLLWAIGVFAAVRVARRRLATSSREARAWLVFLGLVVLLYAVGILAPRPMAQLTVNNASVLAIDFHAHTMYSHDGRSGWTPADVREWHRGAGFDAAYITDHRTFRGAEEGIAANPALAGEGTMLLQGIEVIYRGEHVNILSAGRRYRGLLSADSQDVDEQALMLASLLGSAGPVLVETIPGNLARVTAARGPGAPGVRGIEIVDGAPRGLSQARRERSRIVHLADSFDLALVVGTDNHGWGRAAPAWTLMRIDGWRGMATDSLSKAVEGALRGGGKRSTRVVERRVAAGVTPVDLALAGPFVAWRMFTTLSGDERAVWLFWIWFVALSSWGWRIARLRPSRSGVTTS